MKDNFGWTISRKASRNFCASKEIKNRGWREFLRDSSRGGGCRTQWNHSAFPGEVIGFIVEMFAERRTRKGATFKSVKDVPPARCTHRNLPILRHRCQTAGGWEQIKNKPGSKCCWSQCQINTPHPHTHAVFPPQNMHIFLCNRNKRSCN